MGDLWDWLVTISAFIGAWFVVALVLAWLLGCMLRAINRSDDADR